jgi:hypothetical protein
MQPGFGAPGTASWGNPAPTVISGPQPVDLSLLSPFQRPNYSSWYTRFDYFHWNERVGGMDFVNEDGLLTTIGYQRRVGRERYRLELFGGSPSYDGYGQFADGHLEPLGGHTDYLGLRGEYDFLIEPASWPYGCFVLGVGSRFWFRNLKDGYTDFGSPVWGYQETWWTVYPYLGVESRWPAGSRWQTFGSARVGMTALTYERVSDVDAVLYPRLGVVGQAELGVRSGHFSLSAYMESMTWGESKIVRDICQPNSSLFTLGLQGVLAF